MQVSSWVSRAAAKPHFVYLTLTPGRNAELNCNTDCTIPCQHSCCPGSLATATWNPWVSDPQCTCHAHHTSCRCTPNKSSRHSNPLPDLTSFLCLPGRQAQEQGNLQRAAALFLQQLDGQPPAPKWLRANKIKRYVHNRVVQLCHKFGFANFHVSEQIC